MDSRDEWSELELMCADQGVYHNRLVLKAISLARDAKIVVSCEECGGKGSYQDCGGQGDGEWHGEVPCPSCAAARKRIGETK